MNETYIKEFIIDGNFIDNKNIKEIEEKMFQENLSFIDAIIELDLLEQEVLNKINSLLEGIPEIKLKNKVITLDTFNLIPEPISRTKKIIAFDLKNKDIFLAVPNTRVDYELIKKIIPSEYNVSIFLAKEDDINKKISEYQKLLKYGLLSGVINNLGKITRVEDFGFQSEKDLPKNYMDDIANNYYAEKFIKELLEYAKSSSASHIYINNGEKENLISFRIFGDNYSIMATEKDTLFSISTRLKQLADINIFEKKEIISSASFRAELLSNIVDINLSFVKTIFGESITLEILGEKDFGTEFITVVSEQKEILYKNLDDHKGFYIISGESKSGKTKTTYSIMEYESEKNKEIYSLEETILNRIDFTKQILIDKKTKKELLITKIIQNKPDLISIDYIKPYILKTLFNYVNFGGKIILGIKNDISTFIDTLVEFNFDKGKVIRNFNLFIEHKRFKKIDRSLAKKVYLSKDDLEIFKLFISKKEILELFKKENLISEKISKVEKIEFFTKGKKDKYSDEVYIRGILDLGLNLENSFLKKYSQEKIKNTLKKDVKKSILENSLILSYKGLIDIKDILKYLIK